MQKITLVWLSEINFKQYVYFFSNSYVNCATYFIMAPDSEYKKNHNFYSYGIQFRLSNL